MKERIEKAEFAENLNTKFLLSPDDGNVIELELTTLREMKGEPGTEQFALLFSGPGDVYLPQRIYSLQHERLGAMSIFLVPVARDENGFVYEAVFNRFTK